MDEKKSLDLSKDVDKGGEEGGGCNCVQPRFSPSSSSIPGVLTGRDNSEPSNLIGVNEGLALDAEQVSVFIPAPDPPDERQSRGRRDPPPLTRRGRGRPPGRGRYLPPLTGRGRDSPPLTRRGRGRPPLNGRSRDLASLDGRRDLPPRTGLAYADEGMSISDVEPCQAHVINIGEGEDVVEKILFFSQRIQRAVYIQSGSGVVSSITIRQVSGGTVSYEDTYNIIHLSGIYTEGGISGFFSRTPESHIGGAVTRLIASGLVQNTRKDGWLIPKVIMVLGSRLMLHLLRQLTLLQLSTNGRW